VFWPDPEGNKLSLRNGFLLFGFDYYCDSEHKASQADVYFAVSAILHSMREGYEGQASLRQHIHHRVVISPYAIDRFNDGIVQAAFLRAAFPAELNYADSPQYSEDMREVLLSVFEDLSRQRAEAATEFLFAILTEKLVLRAKDIIEVIKVAEVKTKDYPILQDLVHWIQKEKPWAGTGVAPLI